MLQITVEIMVTYSKFVFSSPPKEFHVDHPVIFYIQEEGVILFVGKL